MKENGTVLGTAHFHSGTLFSAAAEMQQEYSKNFFITKGQTITKNVVPF